jgi:hypothetical protein
MRLAMRATQPWLSQAAAPRCSLWAICGCGRQARIDPAAWMAQGLGRQSVQELETRLRCLCGARQARLEVRGLGEAPQGQTSGIHIFR